MLPPLIHILSFSLRLDMATLSNDASDALFADAVVEHVVAPGAEEAGELPSPNPPARQHSSAHVSYDNETEEFQVSSLPLFHSPTAPPPPMTESEKPPAYPGLFVLVVSFLVNSFFFFFACSRSSDA